MRLFKNLSKQDVCFIAISLLLIVAQVYLDLLLPDFMSNITVLVNSEGNNVQSIITEGVYMLFCALGSGVCSLFVGYLVARSGSDLATTIRKKVYQKIHNFSTSDIKSFSVASLITRTTNDVNQVQQTFTMGLQAIIKAPILAIWAVTKILGRSPDLSIVTGGAILMLFVLVIMIVVFAIPRFKKIQKLIDKINSTSRENLTGARVVKAFNAENYQKQKFDVANKNLTNNFLHIDRVMGLMSPFMSMVMNGMSLAIYWLGSYLVQGAIFTMKLTVFSDMVIFMSYSIQVVSAFIMLTVVFIMLPRAMVSARRINEVLDRQITIVDGDFDSKTDTSGEIEFVNVGFKYPDAEEYVLQNISLKINCGETVAFIGSTGSGKSTLINLIPRFYDVSEGNILIDGVDIKKYKKEELYKKIGYISQNAVIFSGTIKSNLDMNNQGSGITESDINKALEIAQCSEFVSKMKGGTDAEIVRGGKNVSGGQKQRLSIARAIAKMPEIFIFDDTFSALDYKTDKMLRQTLNNTLTKSTKLIVAQRIGTIKNADKIVVLDEGKIVGVGTHEQLMKNCNVYREIALSQFSEGEV